MYITAGLYAGQYKKANALFARTTALSEQHGVLLFTIFETMEFAVAFSLKIRFFPRFGAGNDILGMLIAFMPSFAPSLHLHPLCSLLRVWSNAHRCRCHCVLVLRVCVNNALVRTTGGVFSIIFSAFTIGLARGGLYLNTLAVRAIFYRLSRRCPWISCNKEM